MSECLKKGHLLKCPQKARAFKKWNSRWFVLYGNSPRGRVRLEYYDNEKAWQQERGKRIIPLVHCVSIKPVWNKDYNHVLEIVTSDKTFYLGAGSKEEEKAWFKSLCKIVFGNANRNSIVQVLDRPDPIDMGYHSLDRGTGEEGNLSHNNSLAQSSPQLSKVMGSKEKLGHDCTVTTDLNVTGSSTEARNATSSMSCDLSSLISFESGFDETASVASSIAEACAYKYYVTVRPTIASQQAGMSGQYILQITPSNLILKEMGTENPAAEWPIQHLRRYGRGRTKFSFEAGDKCKTGIGVYTFNTREGDQIFHVVDMHARRLSNQQHSGPMERRLHQHSQSFKPLSETRRRAKSEGRLLESSDDSTINEISESIENMAERLNTGDMPSLMPMNKLSVVNGDGDRVTVEKHDDAGGMMRPRSKTDISMLEDRLVGQQDDDSTSRSEESLLENPANSEFNSAETVKAHEEDIGEPKDESNGKGITSVDGDNAKQNVNEANMKEAEVINVKEPNLINEQDNVEIMVAGIATDGITTDKVHGDSVGNLEVQLVDRLPSESPFVPLFTSEHAKQELMVEDSLVDARDGLEKSNAGEEQMEEIVIPEEKKIATPELVPLKNSDTDILGMNSGRGENEIPRKRKSRKLAQRNRSFEFGSSSEKTVDNKKHSGSFSSFDHRKYREFYEPIHKGDHGRRLQRFTSVKKTVEMYEKITMAANDARQKSFTLWKKKSFKSSQKPEISS